MAGEVFLVDGGVAGGVAVTLVVGLVGLEALLLAWGLRGVVSLEHGVLRAQGLEWSRLLH